MPSRRNSKEEFWIGLRFTAAQRPRLPGPRPGWRARDAHMHLFRSRTAYHANDLAAGGAAHDRIVDQHHALPFEQTAHRVQLEFDAEIAHRLFGLDKSASDIVIADQPEAERDA